MKVKDINFLKESMQKIKCEVIKPKIGKYEEIKEKFKKDGVIEVSDKKGEYLYIHNELSINFKIVDENQKNKLDDYFLRKYKNIAYIDSAFPTKDELKIFITIYFFYPDNRLNQNFSLYINEEMKKQYSKELSEEYDKNFYISNGNNRYYIYSITEDTITLFGKDYYLEFQLEEEDTVFKDEKFNFFEIKKIGKYSKKDKNSYIASLLKLAIGRSIKILDKKEHVSNSIAKRIKEDRGYLNLWEKYASIEGDFLINKARQIGEIKINSASNLEGGYRVLYLENREQIEKLKVGDCLELQKKLPSYFSNEEMEWSDYRNECKIRKMEDEESDMEVEEILEDNLFYETTDIPQFILENEKNKKKKKDNNRIKIYKINKEENSIIVENFNIKNIEKKHLILSILGDQLQIERREKARDKIKEGKAAMPTIGLILNGSLENIEKLMENKIDKIDSLTPFVKEKIFKNEPTQKQKEAIEIALNTPDIAVIQGPPGTGKTTVITAIIERLNERVDKKEDNKGKILITSFQHDAVKNVISRLRINSLPTLKFGRKDEDDFFTEKEIENWCEEVRDKLKQNVSSLEKNLEKEGLLNLYKEYLILPSEYTEEKLLLAIKKISVNSKLIERIDTYLSESSFKEDSILLNNIRKFRTTKEGFLDGGAEICYNIYISLKELVKNNKKFENTLKLLEKGYLIKDNEVDEDFLKSMFILKNNLLNLLIPKPIYKKERINNEIKEIYKIAEQELCTPKNEEEKIIFNFYNEISNNSLFIKKILENYCFVYSATTQQSEGAEIRKAKGKVREDPIYDVVIVDEAARVNPLDLMIPLSQAAKKIILVGDHRQLPHVYNEDIFDELQNDGEIDENLREKGISQSMFEYLKEKADELEKKDNIKRTITLDRQYRMHKLLGNFINQNFYEVYNEGFHSPLADEIFKQDFYKTPLVWIDIKNTVDKEIKKGTSRKRESEANIIVNKLKEMITSGKGEKLTYGVISFYKAQVDEIIEKLKKEGLNDKVKVGSVDAFQGMEFDVMFLSVVRTNTKESLNSRFPYGFLASENRLCVALSRQKRLLVVVGDSDIFYSKEWKELAKKSVPAMVNLYELCLKEGEIIDGSK
ncbi:hypothetical protein EII28_05320 [Fusobacterium nucleatum]|uniref:AAA+ ATPase domain-containing protein n=1 Tax=Fusobacterium nucleatum TaxID=851 RepID=A0A3P1VVH5_FUSNU|nr:ATP-binding protein [Fusobacterium nucleatum]RRD37456.1 hypothetical protein EII28_05320 [Fusobacterium nucleatum]